MKSLFIRITYSIVALALSAVLYSELHIPTVSINGQQRIVDREFTMSKSFVEDVQKHLDKLVKEKGERLQSGKNKFVSDISGHAISLELGDYIYLDYMDKNGDYVVPATIGI